MCTMWIGGALQRPDRLCLRSRAARAVTTVAPVQAEAALRIPETPVGCATERFFLLLLLDEIQCKAPLSTFMVDQRCVSLLGRQGPGRDTNVLE